MLQWGMGREAMWEAPQEVTSLPSVVLGSVQETQPLDKAVLHSA